MDEFCGSKFWVSELQGHFFPIFSHFFFSLPIFARFFARLLCPSIRLAYGECTSPFLGLSRFLTVAVRLEQLLPRTPFFAEFTIDINIGQSSLIFLLTLSMIPKGHDVSILRLLKSSSSLVSLDTTRVFRND